MTLNLHTIGQALSRLALSRRLAVALTGAAVTSCIATYVVLTRLSYATDTVYWLLNLDLILLLMMGTVITHRIARLWGERRRGIAGAQLHVRLVMAFGSLAAVPVIIMAIFSSVFLYFGVHAWFNERVSTAIHESMAVAQSYLREHQQVIRADVLAMANDLNRAAPFLLRDEKGFGEFMQTQSELRNLPEAIVTTADGKVLSRSRLSFTLEMSNIPEKALTAASGGDVVLMTGSERDRIRALVRLELFPDAYLYVGRMVDANVLAHVQRTDNAVKEYTDLQSKKAKLQLLVTGIFIVLSLILMLAAAWFGLVFAERLVTPISALILAAERVRAGDMAVRVPASDGDDEIALLGRAFNRMTRQIESQRDALVAANQMLDDRRRFTEAVLAGASSGIIGLDDAGLITLANARAEELLSASAAVGQRLADLLPPAAELVDKARTAPDRPASLQLEHAAHDAPRRHLFLRLTIEKGGGGAVLTIDDVTALAAAQRKSAWADVARRIAHEIKNPLTPIQLAAERLKRKYLPQILEDPDTFERCTETIVRQVSEIGHMVNEFSSYARMPEPVKRNENVVEVCRDALLLPMQAHADIVFDFSASDAVVIAECDRSQLTQVMTNLLQNAIDSIHERQAQKPGEGRIAVLVGRRDHMVVVTVEDNGLGLPEKVRDQLTEPYVTTKKKGSGLGLAIVKKIMEDHDGSILLENSVIYDTVAGVKATILFPGE